MKQLLGLEFSQNKTVKMIIALRLAQLVGYYSATELLGSMVRSKRNKGPVKHIDIHITNLYETYSQKAVEACYNELFKMSHNKASKAG